MIKDGTTSSAQAYKCSACLQPPEGAEGASVSTGAHDRCTRGQAFATRLCCCRQVQHRGPAVTPALHAVTRCPCMSVCPTTLPVPDIPLSLTQALGPVLVYAAGIAFGTEQWSQRTAGILLLVVAGVLTASQGKGTMQVGVCLCNWQPQVQGGTSPLPWQYLLWVATGFRGGQHRVTRAINAAKCTPLQTLQMCTGSLHFHCSTP